MIKASEKKEAQTRTLQVVYDLVLNPEISDEERQILLTFKNHLEAGKDFDKELCYLSENLRQLSVKRLSQKRALSPAVRDFYKDFITTGLKEAEIARGLASVGIWLN